MITRGEKQAFLGMDIELLDDNKIEISMKSYIQEAILFLTKTIPQKYCLQNIKIRTKLIQTPILYQRSTQNIFIPSLQSFYGQLNEHEQMLELRFLSFLI